MNKINPQNTLFFDFLIHPHILPTYEQINIFLLFIFVFIILFFIFYFSTYFFII